jgi:hypothetical protein
MQHEKLVKFKGKNDRRIVPRGYEQDKTFANWVTNQRTVHTDNKMRIDRKKLLDKLGFVWKVDRAVNKNNDKNND